MLKTGDIVNRYILVSNKENVIIYSDKVIWKWTEFDRLVEKEIKFDLTAQHFVVIIDSTNNIETVDSAKNNIIFSTKTCGSLTLNYQNYFDGFVSQNSSEKKFNPLIDYCSFFTCYVNDGVTFDAKRFEYLHEHRQLLGEIQERLDIDLERHPYLLGTYFVYTPTRLLIDCEFIDKPKPTENRVPKELKITILDEFMAYQNCNLLLTIFGEQHIDEIIIPINNITYIKTLSEFPRELSFAVHSDNNLIFQKRHGFVRQINVSANAVVGSVMLEDGSKQDIIHKMDFVVGDKNEL